jgi:hypothetical protein
VNWLCLLNKETDKILRKLAAMGLAYQPMLAERKTRRLLFSWNNIIFERSRWT